jgi:hypothetical protein
VEKSVSRGGGQGFIGPNCSDAIGQDFANGGNVVGWNGAKYWERLAADVEADVADGLLVGQLTFFARVKPGFLKKPGFLNLQFFNLLQQKVKPGPGQSIRTRKFMLFPNSYRPNAVAPTGWFGVINN